MAAAKARHNLLGIGSLTLGVLVFSLQDTIIKSVSGEYAVTLAVSIRCLVAIPLLVLIVHLECGLRRLNTPQVGLLVLRGCIMLVAYTSYYMALPALPLAEAIALFFMTPVFITLMASLFLDERATWRTWLAVGVGLTGVFVILQPGSALFEPAALFSLLSAAAYSASMIIARKNGDTTPASVMTFYQNAVFIIGAEAIALAVWLLGLEPPGHPSLDFLFRAWALPSGYDLLLLGLCGVIAGVGSTLLTHAYRIGEASVVTPFEYTGMIWGSVWGYFLFGESLQLTTCLGMALIAIAGFLAIRPEQPVVSAP